MPLPLPLPQRERALHPALELVVERARNGSKPGCRTDPFKLGLVVEVRLSAGTSVSHRHKSCAQGARYFSSFLPPPPPLVPRRLSKLERASVVAGAGTWLQSSHIPPPVPIL